MRVTSKLRRNHSIYQTESNVASKASLEVVHDTARVMDKSWEIIQTKTFTNWINSQLVKNNLAPLNNLFSDFANGEKLIQLLEIIGGDSLGKYNKNPRLRIQKIENANKALNFIKGRGVNLTNIGGEDLADENSKLILGLIWTIILRFTISEINEEGLTAREGLLLWCQKRTTPYSRDFSIKDFTFSWQSGLALCGLIHRHRPDLLDYSKLNKSDPRANVALAFEIAQEHLGIPKLFGVEDLVDVIKPDERSVMTYVAQYFHAFSTLDKVAAAGRRIGQFVGHMETVWLMQNDYESRARKLIEGVTRIQKRWSVYSFTAYADAKVQLTDFDEYKATLKRTWITEKRDVERLSGNIATKLNNYHLKPYTPPAGLTLNDLDNIWVTHLSKEADFKRSISAFIAVVKDKLKRKYADASNEFCESLIHISRSLASLSGDLNMQLKEAESLSLLMEPLRESISNIESLNDQCLEANIEDNEYTIHSVDDLIFDFQILLQSINNNISFIENQIVARKITNLTPQLLEEYSETFRSLARESNTLKHDEFRAALLAEGKECSEDEFESLFLRVSENGTEIKFEQFIEFMKSTAEDTTTKEQLKESFLVIAQEKDHLTESDMETGYVPTHVIEFLKSTFPKVHDGFDYNEYLDTSFLT